MSEAWEQGAGMLRGNLRVIFGIAGVFFFVPVAALIFMLPDLSQDPVFAGKAENPAAMMAAIQAVFMEMWWIIAIVVVLQGIGVLTLYRLLSDRTGPTVGETLAFGATAFVPYIGATLLGELVRLLLIGIPTTLATAVGLGGVMTVVGLVATVYLYVKFSLIAAVVGIERQFNPIKALQQSWRLTKGNSLRLFLFYFLLAVAFVVIWLVVSLVLTVIFGLAGAELANFGFTLATAAAVTFFWAVMIAVLTATHQQLGGRVQKIEGRWVG